MIRQSLVFPFREYLVPDLRGLSVVPRIETFDDVPAALNSLYAVGANPRCLLVESKMPLVNIRIIDGLGAVPIALYVPELGPLPEFLRLLPLLRQLNLRVYMPAAGEGNMTSLRILSSLGIETAVLFQGGEPDWDDLSDLMTYAFFGQMPHAPIAPFGYLLDNFDQRGRSEFGVVYFDDPRSYLHLDEKGHVALTNMDLKKGQFLAESIDELGDDVESQKPYDARLEDWREHFLRFDQCSTCPGWRACSGWFGRERQPDDSCRKFCSELLNNLETSSLSRREPLTVWRP